MTSDLYDLDILEKDYLPVLQKKSNVILKMLEGKKVLEVGCGTGNLLNILSINDLELHGSDYSNEYLTKAKQKNPNIEFFQGSLTDPTMWGKYNQKFDSIICSEVLEHLPDDLKALKIIHTLLKPNGVLIITVPALMLLYSEFDEKIGHYRRYSMNSICSVVVNAGFDIVQNRFWNFLGMFGWLILFKVLKKDIKKTSSPLLGQILGSWLKLEMKISFPIGQTIMIKARKK